MMIKEGESRELRELSLELRENYHRNLFGTKSEIRLGSDDYFLSADIRQTFICFESV